MSESERIQKDFDNFLKTGDDRPHKQRAHDKKLADRCLFAPLWFGAVGWSLFIWFLIVEFAR